MSNYSGFIFFFIYLLIFFFNLKLLYSLYPKGHTTGLKVGLRCQKTQKHLHRPGYYQVNLLVFSDLNLYRIAYFKPKTLKEYIVYKKKPYYTASTDSFLNVEAPLHSCICACVFVCLRQTYFIQIHISVSTI